MPVHHLLEVKNLNFSFSSTKPLLKDISFSLGTGERLLLAGANGTGKSTLLDLCAGGRMPQGNHNHSILVAGRSPFYDSGVFSKIAHVGGELDLVLDISFLEMLEQAQARDKNDISDLDLELQNLLDIEPHWRMHQLSQGQKKRVELFFSLRKPEAQLFLFDEVTAHLDVDVRERILEWLKNSRKTVIYCTHIFDSLCSPKESWADCLLWLGHNGVYTFLDPPTFRKFVQEKMNKLPHLSAWVTKAIRRNQWIET